MAEQHRATPEQWQAIKASWDLPLIACVLELLHRIEALESAAESNHPEKPDSSLVERVALTLAGPNDDAELWMLDARAAIREVVAWMTSNPDHHFPPALVFALEQEAER